MRLSRESFIVISKWKSNFKLLWNSLSFYHTFLGLLIILSILFHFFFVPFFSSVFPFTSYIVFCNLSVVFNNFSKIDFQDFFLSIFVSLKPKSTEFCSRDQIQTKQDQRNETWPTKRIDFLGLFLWNFCVILFFELSFIFSKKSITEFTSGPIEWKLQWFDFLFSCFLVSLILRSWKCLQKIGITDVQFWLEKEKNKDEDLWTLLWFLSFLSFFSFYFFSW